MNNLSEAAREALKGAYATRGKNRGQLLAKCPRSDTLAAAAWQGAMMSCNPYQVSIGAVLFMNPLQRELFEEVKNHFDALPEAYRIMAQRDREALEILGSLVMHKPQWFPRYRAHAEVTCFNCDGDLLGEYWSASGCAAGRGAFMQSCEKCNTTTWYDLEKKR